VVAGRRRADKTQAEARPKQWGRALLLVAGVLALAGRSPLRRATPAVPRETVENVHRDVEAVKGAVHR
jgi:hypothetical protein